MMKVFTIIGFVVLFIAHDLMAQQGRSGILTGTVRDRKTQELLVGVSVVLQGTEPPIGASTNPEGTFRITAPVGSYNVVASFIGYKSLVKYNIVLTSGNVNTLVFELEEDTQTLGEVEVRANRGVDVTTVETPLSIQRLTTEEIKSNPGGNFDISRVIQALPGVGSTAGSVGGFRNDIIIRGGAPNENVYYLDGIEIPVINHFATQGSAGGPTGILNVSFIEDVTLSSSAFEARYDNALASVLQFKQREGSTERVQGNIRLSATELAVTTEGPLSPKTTFLASARRSYLQLLFQAIDLPIRPNYWDFQYKVTHQLNAKTTLTALGVGAIDDFSFGEPRSPTPEKEYILRSQPAINQWNYTTGFAVKRLLKNGFATVALSRNMFDNRLDRFEDRQLGDESRRILRVGSQEIENKLRVEVNQFAGGWKYSYGLVGQYVKFNNRVFNRIRREITNDDGLVVQPEVVVNFDTELDFFRYGGFFQVSRSFFNERLGMSFGIRTDMNTFTDTGNNPLETLSPRLSLSYALADGWNWNASVGTYYKIPIYTVLGYQDEQGNFANRDARYIRSTHYVTGLEYLPRQGTRFTLEGFYKDYGNYPVSVRDGISLANQGGDFGAIGNEKVVSTGNGRAYGLEFLFQQKLIKNFFAVFSYTFVRSEFSGIDGVLLPSAWDNRHLVSGILGKKFKRGWETGLRYRYAGGAPVTPFDLEASQRNFPSLGFGVLDLSQLNSQRLPAFSQLDVRIDKKWNFQRVTLDLFLDITNLLFTPNPAFPQFTFARTADNSAFATTDGQPLRTDGSNGIPVILANDDPVAIPTIGFILEF
jgi:hypothetical protein